MTEARKKEIRRICTSGLDPVWHHHLMEMYYRRNLSGSCDDPPCVRLEGMGFPKDERDSVNRLVRSLWITARRQLGLTA